MEMKRSRLLNSKAIVLTLLVLGAVVAVAASAAQISTATAPNSPRESDPKLATVTRGDMLVTVIEEGTLESSNNIEIRSKVEGSNARSIPTDG